ncbi:transcriptional regulator [Putridiphycobacter roseus]|uniref:Transcriptional regulator n=1 Tax=Putridiphycobacter roseus TaxID=2219161 RepID=A0A2W1NN65_9FLAO|nr:winged helix-turn-helix transcriptional regulator [Putridiphycobacter roseus]PZE16008.1 transcriptional regulator [Putridiphycobacter roseus]
MIRTIDKTDKQILSLLIENANITHKEIAKQIDVSPATIHLRIKKMEQKGVIKGASVNIDYQVIGYNLTAYIGIILSRTKGLEKVMKDLIKIPEVTVANITTGQFGAFCKIRCKDTNHMKKVIFKINALNGIIRTESMISMEETVNDKSRLFNSAFDF